MENTISEIELSYKPRKVQTAIQRIVNSEDAYKVFLETWDEGKIELCETFKVAILNNSNEVLGICTLSSGGLSATLVDLRLLFSIALKSCASAIITAHNHPSGKLKPSGADISIYRKIKEVANFHDIKYLDNLIVTTSGKYSFSDEFVN
jgi:DNA repair protein RadC